MGSACPSGTASSAGPRASPARWWPCPAPSTSTTSTTKVDGLCLPEWDGIVCWPEGVPGKVVAMPCPPAPSTSTTSERCIWGLWETQNSIFVLHRLLVQGCP
ncbi:hypothetical protein HGM15179_022156, partial [Zosterops borbonicus]